MDNHAEVDEILRVHHRRRWWPWACACGSRYPCSPRRRALDESLRMTTREVIEWYPTYFARRAHAESQVESRAETAGESPSQAPSEAPRGGLDKAS